MFKFRKISHTFGYETAVYEVDLDKKYTVKEFVDTVLSRGNEWGYVFIINPRQKVCDYSYGRLVGCVDESFFDKIIDYVESDGGWSRMDYYIKIKEN